jgi:hypothetical protein
VPYSTEVQQPCRPRTPPASRARSGDLLQRPPATSLPRVRIEGVRGSNPSAPPRSRRPPTGDLQIRSLEGARAPQPAAGRYAPARTCQGSLRDPCGQTLDRTSPAQIPAAIGFGGGVVGRQNHVRLRSIGGERDSASGAGDGTTVRPGGRNAPESLGALPSRPRSCRPAPHRTRGTVAP